MVSARQPKIKPLKLFVAIMRLGTLTAAAERIHSTQSAASRLLSGLEQDLGLTLFERKRQRLIPTEQAELLLPEVERVISVTENFPAISQSIREQASSHIQMVTYSRFAQEIIPCAVERLTAAFVNTPRVTVNVRSRGQIRRWISGSQFDFALATLPIEHPDVATEAIAYLPLLALMSRDNRLSAERNLSASTLTDVPLALLSGGTLIRERIDRFFSEAGVVPNVRYEVDSSIAAYQIAARTGAVAFCDGIVPPSLVESRVALRHLEGAHPIALGFAETPRSRHRGDIDAFKTAIREVVAERLALARTWLHAPES